MERKHSLIRTLFRGTGPSYDQVVLLATLGADWWWKRAIHQVIREELFRRLNNSRGHYQNALDLACGTGILTMRLPQFHPRKIVGVDLNQEYLDIACRKADDRGLTDVHFLHTPAEDIRNLPDKFDLVVTSYLPKYAEISTLVAACWEVTTPGALLVFHDFRYPDGWCRWLYSLHWKFLSLALNRFRAWRAMASGLPEIIAESDWEDRLQRALIRQGFTTLPIKRLPPFQTASILCAYKPD